MMTPADVTHLKQAGDLLQEKLHDHALALEELAWLVTKINELQQVASAYQRRAVVLAGALKEVL